MTSDSVNTNVETHRCVCSTDSDCARLLPLSPIKILRGGSKPEVVLGAFVRRGCSVDSDSLQSGRCSRVSRRWQQIGSS